MSSDRTIENPILNSPFEEPRLHFKFDERGITPEKAEGRRSSSYFIPIARPKKRGAATIQTVLFSSERIEENANISRIRQRVSQWRQGRYAGVTPLTRRLLEHWTNHDRENKLFFCQIEALETAIYLTEVANHFGDPWIEKFLKEHNEAHNAGLYRIAFKMATGSGKTVVMAMLIVWQSLNKILNPQNKLFSDTFLIVTPNITIKDRLRVLQPSNPENYYQQRDLLPHDLWPLLGKSKIHITNFHAFLLRETLDAPKLNKMILSGGQENAFKETLFQMVRRVCKELGNKQNIVVLNDEAHHCYRGRESTEGGEPIGEELTGEERKDAKKREEEARVWISGLEAIQKKLGIRAIYDLSATPSFLKGSGYPEGKLFPWVVSDFSLIDAIECGIVKIPRVPVDDDAATPDQMPKYRNLWKHIKDDLPKRGRAQTEKREPRPPAVLEGAIQSLYSHYEKSYKDWVGNKEAQDRGLTPPVFIVVCSNTAVSKMVYDFVSGYEKQLKKETRLIPGQYEIFSNIKNDEWLKSPNTILVDSEQLESGEALKGEFKEYAAEEIEDFKDEYRRRYPEKDVENITDAEILREVMNTVGKQGKLGENIKCVVSVSMLTEGWDANTVTHILGIRAFGTQLLCEQVIGRGLRRRSYSLNPDGKFSPEYAEIYGVPFDFLPTAKATSTLSLGVLPTRVRAIEERVHLEIKFPLLEGYRYDVTVERLKATYNDDQKITLSTMDVPTRTEIEGVIGEKETLTLDKLKGMRINQVDFRLAKEVLEKHFREQEGGDKPWLFPQILQIVKDWREKCLVLNDDTYPQILLLKEYAIRSAEKIYRSIVSAEESKPLVKPRLRYYNPVGSTRVVDFDTLKPTVPTRADRCHINYVVCDTNSWEQKVASSLEEMNEVIRYFKNTGQLFSIPYVINDESRNYIPDFVAVLNDGRGHEDPLNLIIEVTGEKKKDKEAKVDTARNLWVPAINNHGGFGRWGFIEVREPDRVKAMVREYIETLKMEKVVIGGV